MIYFCILENCNIQDKPMQLLLNCVCIFIQTTACPKVSLSHKGLTLFVVNCFEGTQNILRFISFCRYLDRPDCWNPTSNKIGTVYSIWPISWLLMTWRHKEPWYQDSWYRTSSPGIFQPQYQEDLNTVNIANVIHYIATCAWILNALGQSAENWALPWCQRCRRQWHWRLSSGATSDDNVGIMTGVGFQVSWHATEMSNTSRLNTLCFVLWQKTRCTTPWCRLTKGDTNWRFRQTVAMCNAEETPTV